MNSSRKSAKARHILEQAIRGCYIEELTEAVEDYALMLAETNCPDCWGEGPQGDVDFELAIPKGCQWVEYPWAGIN